MTKKLTVFLAITAAAGLGLALMAALPLQRPQPGSSYTVEIATGSFADPGQRQAVADFTFQDAAGATRSIGSFKGKVVLVNFWATWCGPCVKEMPALSMLQTRMAGHAFEVLALSQDRGGSDVAKRFYDQQKITNLKVYLDQGGKAGRVVGLKALPTTVLIDTFGREVLRVEGPVDWDDDAMVAAIQRVVAGY